MGGSLSEANKGDIQESKFQNLALRNHPEARPENEPLFRTYRV